MSLKQRASHNKWHIEVDWSREAMVEYVRDCRLAQGLPMFRTTFKPRGSPKEERFRFEGGVVRGICYGGSNDPKRGGKGADYSANFHKTPSAVIDKLERKRDDWIWILKEYATAGERDDLVKDIREVEIPEEQQVKGLDAKQLTGTPLIPLLLEGGKVPFSPTGKKE